MASTVDWMAMSGVRSSCATSVVRRRSSSRSRSMESAISSNVSPRRAISSSPCSFVRAARSPSLMARAVLVMRLMGLTSARANRKPMHDASTMASTVANTMAWYELSRNSSSVERSSASDPSTHTFTDPTATPSCSMLSYANWLFEVGCGASDILPAADFQPSPDSPICVESQTKPPPFWRMETPMPLFIDAVYSPAAMTSGLSSVPVSS